MELYVINNIYDGAADYNVYRNIIKLGLIQNYTSVQWLTEFDDSGEFCIECIATEDNIKILRPNYLVVRNDIDEWAIGIIQKVSIKDNRMVVRGTLDALDHIINMNISTITNIKTGIASMLAQSYIPFQLSKSSVDANISELDVLYKNFREVIKMVCKEANVGYSTVGKYTVKLYPGKIITNSILSDVLDNIIDQAIELDNTGIKSMAIVLGEEKDSKKTIVKVTNPLNVNTYSEVFVDAKNVSRKYKNSSGVEKTYTEKEYEEILNKKGLEKLENCIPINKFSCELNPTYEHFKLGVDYQLGDIIRVTSTKYNYSVYMRIIKVKEIFEENKKVIITLENKEG